MARELFERDLQRLEDELLLMVSMVSQALQASVKALKKQDILTAKQLIRDDRDINAKRYAIEENSLLLITTQQPMAGDTRLIAAFLELCTELERIGDYAKGIGKITLYIGKEPLAYPMVEIASMCDKVIDMLDRAIDAFIQRDVDAAYAIPKEDDEIDLLYNQIHRNLLRIMVEDPDKIDQVNYLLWAAHDLERAGDRVTNICERVIFTVTGEFVEMDEVYSDVHSLTAPHVAAAA